MRQVKPRNASGWLAEESQGWSPDGGSDNSSWLSLFASLLLEPAVYYEYQGSPSLPLYLCVSELLLLLLLLHRLLLFLYEV